MTAEETFLTLHERTHRRPVKTATNAAAQARSKTTGALDLAAPASTDRVDKAPGPAATTSRLADTDPTSTADHLAGAAPATDATLADEHHPAQPRTNRPGRSDQ